MLGKFVAVATIVATTCLVHGNMPVAEAAPARRGDDAPADAWYIGESEAEAPPPRRRRVASRPEIQDAVMDKFNRTMDMDDMEPMTGMDEESAAPNATATKPCCGGHDHKGADQSADDDDEDYSDEGSDDAMNSTLPHKAAANKATDRMFRFDEPRLEINDNAVYNSYLQMSNMDCEEQCEAQSLVWECMFYPVANATNTTALTKAPAEMSADERLDAFGKSCQCSKQAIDAFAQCFTCVGNATNTTFPSATAMENICKLPNATEFAAKYNRLMALSQNGSLSAQEAADGAAFGSVSPVGLLLSATVTVAAAVLVLL